MTDVVRDFDALYAKLEAPPHNLRLVLECCAPESGPLDLAAIQERKSYTCCALNNRRNCVLHKCVVVVFGTALDARLRAPSAEFDAQNNLRGTFMLDGRFLSFPNIMMNNNVLMHNFYDKLYAKHCKRMFLYGNVDAEKHINRAIQLVYDKATRRLFARDVYASDYVVTDDLNAVLETYLASSGKWRPLDHLFRYSKAHKQQLVDHIKMIMHHDICYSIDNLANKIIYKHAYLMELLLTSTVLQHYQKRAGENEALKRRLECEGEPPASKRRKAQSVLYGKESKKIVDSVVNGRLIYCVSKTFSKQRRSFPNQHDNCSNNNIEISLPVLKYRVGSEVTRITNDSVRQKMLKQKKDFVKFIGSFFHGEMTVAGKKFFLCRNARLPNVDYAMVADKFAELQQFGLVAPVHDLAHCADGALLIAFNDRPTNLQCARADVPKIVYRLKRDRCPIELKASSNILYVNHHEGMVCIAKRVRIGAPVNASINALLTPYEYHYKNSLFHAPTVSACEIEESDDVRCLMSKLEQYYFAEYTHLFYTIPVPKMIVALTNLKNAMPVLRYSTLGTAPVGLSVAVGDHVLMNNKMVKLWTLVRDSKLMTAEDPYIPHMALPIRLYNHKVNKLKGKLALAGKAVPTLKFVASSGPHNCVVLPDNMVQYFAGTVLSGAKIVWAHDGKRCMVEACTNGAHNVYKVYVFFRRTRNQAVESLAASMTLAGDAVIVRTAVVTSTDDLEGVKVCSVHGQKGVLNRSEDLTEWMAEDGTHAQICLSPVSYLSRQSNFERLERKYVVRGGNHADPRARRYPIFNIPYMLFNNTPDNIYKEFNKKNYTGHEKVEGTRFDQWTKNQSFVGNRLAESLQWMRGGSNLPQNCGEFEVVSSLLMCNNVVMK
ncbi:late expression factor 8 [Orgyia pseudotsugata multiple nucleopolyhedrovirus]|uniref:Probable DNA-directed RNA polymerase subunit beta n=1 Tax=Orgyia pseudotsugata multicapsid polyhedrosis virus TaxID=262177 RepID=RPOB_NPVOP|nr:late expression factor 8 [Orgyia pseudotsugata multiple nucleopolyhedrovirus]O12934.1 RecName: Full=Probable DNA-directed RNA polymerase subunit beta; AltName: Full=Late expression factor 8 [Orgyia pseudotsugata multiple nucleopolyhedrovirus]pir/T10323/ late expression factor 8 protein - Orgyia pseudotsugata nuclear polyhedrosis virus [Orgyia pseudotsugata single capsid nuclopolyhedrovirus]AAC59053.1 late expression factor 8 [Orgyia pseudotsugata multiple nucleopolyhedrovirus]